MTETQWSRYQTDIFDDVENRAGPLSVNAVAGSGKTTTLVECAHRWPSGYGKVLAFNRVIAQELARRLPTRYGAQTFNAAGFRQVVNRIRNVKVDGRKLFFIMAEDEFAALHGADKLDLRQDMRFLVDLMKANAHGINGEVDILELIDNKEIDTDPLSRADFAALAQKLFTASLNNLNTIDFSDQLYLPLAKGWRFDRFPVVFADEAQDLSPIQHLMLHSMTDNIVAFGDPHQAIYAFRGADSSSMKNLLGQTGARELPLSVSYRCPKAIVEEARRYVPHIESHPDAPDGNISVVPIQMQMELMFSGQVPDDALILCRNNKPLVRVALEFLSHGVACNILTNFPDQLKKFVKKFEADTMQELEVRLRAWYDKYCEEYENKPGRLASITDKYESMLVLMDGCDTVDGVLTALERMTRSTSGPRISTIHKAKGLEARDVFFIGPELIPGKFAKTKSALQQENNLAYVAITRAMQNLHYVPFE